MARRSQQSDANSTAKRSSDRVSLKKAGAKAGEGRRAQAKAQESTTTPSPSILDERTKRDIGGIACGIASVALFVAAVLPPSGVLTQVLSQILHVGLGLGCYLLPFVMLITCVCVLWRTDNPSFGLRVGIGLFLLLLSLMALFSLFTPGAVDDPSALFERDSTASVDQLSVRGGYVGAAIAWVLLSLFGLVISTLLLIGTSLGAVVIIGFSLSGAVKTLEDKGREVAETRRLRRQEESAESRTHTERLWSRSRTRQFASEPEAPVHDLAPAAAQTAQPSQALHATSSQPKRSIGFGRVRLTLEADPEASEQSRRNDAVPHVPRDLSKPRRASQSLSQSLEADHSVQGGPRTEIVDMYWPEDYAYHEDDLGVFEDEPQASPEPSRVLAVDEGSRSRRRLEDMTGEVVLPWEDEPVSAAVEDTAATSMPDTDAPVFTGAAAVGAGVAAAAATGAAGAQTKPQKRKLSSAASKKSSDSTIAAASFAASTSEVGETRNGFTLPAFALIKHTARAAAADEAALRSTAEELQRTLEDFSINAQVIGWVAGPTVTLFKVDLPSGVRVSRVMSLTDDIALALAAPGVRIFAPIPGTNHVGIEVPNKTRQNVLLGDVLKDAHGAPLEMAIGKDVEGNSIVVDLAKMPHLLIGGTTGSGKSVAINAMIMSILMRATPDEVRFIMIDPKRVEFTPYNGIPHLYVPVVTENNEAASALAWGVAEMERRLKVMSKAGVRNIGQYNAKVEAGQLTGQDDESQPAKAGAAPEEAEGPRKLPYIVIIIDELADLMMNVGKEVELSISRIAQLARAAGIHMIVATQRPSTNVVTGLIKANITNRIAFNVASGIDSRVILDTPGAENLIGLGDMLFSKPEWPKPQRLQGCFVSESEIEAVVAHLKGQGEPEYNTEILSTNVITLGASAPDGSGGSGGADDPLVWEAADIVVSNGLGSTSNIQRRLSVGYARAGRIMDMLEEKGIVGPPNGSKPREVLVDAMELETLKAFEERD